MNSKTLNDNLPSFEEMHISGLKMLVIIVNREDGEKTEKLLRERHFFLQFACMAEGTQGSEIMDLLGFGSIDKIIVFCISPAFRIDAALTEVAEKLNLKKAGKGIAFTVPLFGISLPQIASEKISFPERWQNNIENGVDKVNNSITHSLILAIVDQGNSEDVVKVAKTAGATGGTVINARRTGADDVIKFFGITVQMEKEIVAILTDRDSKQAIMDAVNNSFGIQSPAHGIIISVPVDGVAGNNDVHHN